MADLKAGRELDALIAEKVMGYMWQGNPRGNRTLHAPTGRQVGIKERGKPLVIFGSDTSPYLPAYSTDIAAAWEVVEGLHARHSRQIFSLTRVGSGKWDAAFNGWDTAKAETAPLAICLAALQAVEVPHV